ncbi:unnamed protein product [Effrenium voratum]|uniref:Uncharacterized protein n=1 Tax=Effrenium voratum TaxID=2562239 RepID=A0AA36INV5_9DINO|nr:unnamed protein product [Effrenium voratum]
MRSGWFRQRAQRCSAKNRIAERRGQPGGWSRRGSQFCMQESQAKSAEAMNPGQEERRPVLHAERVVQAKSAEVLRQDSNCREEGPARRLEQERQPVLHAESLQAKSAEAMNPGQEERRPVLHAERVVQAKSAEVLRQDSNCREEGPARRVEQERQPVLHAESLQAKSAEAMNPGQEERLVQAKSAEVFRQGLDSNCREEGPARRVEQERQPVLHAESLQAKSAEAMNPGQEERRPVLHAERVVQAKSADVLRQDSNCREEGPARRVEQERQPVLHAESLLAKSAEAMNPGQEERRPVLHAERVVQAKSAEVFRQVLHSKFREEGPARRLEQERQPVLHAESLQAKSAEAMNPGHLEPQWQCLEPSPEFPDSPKSSPSKTSLPAAQPSPPTATDSAGSPSATPPEDSWAFWRSLLGPELLCV